MSRLLFAALLAALASCAQPSAEEPREPPAETAAKRAGPDEVPDLPEVPLRRRFSNLSTGPDLVLLRIDSPSHEETTVLMENVDALFLMSELNERDFKNEEYVEFMLENHGKTFRLSDERFEKLAAEGEALLLPEHRALQGKGRRRLVAEYMKKAPWSDEMEGVDLYLFRFDAEPELPEREARSLARLFIEEGLSVFRDCESGFWECGIEVPKGTKFDRVEKGKK